MKARLKEWLHFFAALPKKHPFLLWGNLCCLILFLTASVLLHHVCNSLPDQQAVKRWTADENARFAQLSCFFVRDAGVTEETVRQLRSDIDKRLLESAVAPPKENARLWFDAYSAEGSLDVSRGSVSVKASVTAVGGDFFLIHPLSFRTGYPFSKDDAMDDRVVLDWNLAWRLFGSFDVTGMELTINGTYCYVAGVAASSQKWPVSETYGELPHIYMSYSLYHKLYPQESITCYETVMVDPVPQFAGNLLSDCLPGEEEGRITVENSSRFGKLSLLRLVESFGSRSTQTKAIRFPYWENAARVAEDYASLLFCLSLLFLLFPAGCAVSAAIRTWKRRKIFLRYALQKGIRLWEALKPKLNDLKSRLKKKKEEVPL